MSGRDVDRLAQRERGRRRVAAGGKQRFGVVAVELRLEEALAGALDRGEAVERRLEGLVGLTGGEIRLRPRRQEVGQELVRPR